MSKGQMMQNNKWCQSGQGKVHWFSGSMQSMQPSSAVRKGPRPAQIWTHTHTENCKTSKYKHKIQNCMQHRKVET